MISSAGANKQPRSFWMSSSQRLQQRLPIWSGFPPSVTTDCSSEALATLPTLLVESPAPKNADRSSWREQKSTRHLSGDHRICWLCVYILNLSKLQDCPFFAVILSWSLGSISVEGLFFPLCLPLGDKCPTPAISCAGGVDGHLRWDSYKLSCAFALKPISSATSSVFAFPDSWRREEWLHAFLLLQLIQGSEVKLIYQVWEERGRRALRHGASPVSYGVPL